MPNGELVCLVCIPIVRDRSVEELAAILSHEAMHVVQSLFESIGEEKPGHETQAYAMQNILYQLMISYKKKSKRR